MAAREVRIRLGEKFLPPGPGLSPHTQIQKHLETILNSDGFAGAWRQRRLLEYLVEECLTGRPDNLKEYCVGIEVFEKGEDFDPRLNPIVRVEASRLRNRLKRYYATQGKDDQIRICLPRGSYIPEFLEKDAGPVRLDASARTDALQPQIALDQRRWTPQRIGVLGACLTLIAALGVGGAIRSLRSNDDVKTAYSFARITRGEDRCSSPTVSPDGRFLAYVFRASGGADIYVRSINSEKATNLTADSPSDDTSPAYSPDGRQIAFRSERDGGGIYVVGASGGRSRRVASFGYYPSWSPDGKYVVVSDKAFVTPEDGSPVRNSRLYSVDVGSGAVRQMTSPRTVYDAIQPSWSPDGRRIAFWGADSSGNRDIWTMRADAVPGKENAVAVTNDAWVDWDPTWSPDGRYLFFVSDRDGAMNLRRVRIDENTGTVMGEPESVVTPSNYGIQVALSRDGNRIFYVDRHTSSKLYKASVDGLERPQAIPIERTSSGERLRELSMSPDGQWLAVRIQDPLEDVALIRPDGSGLRRLTNDRFSDRFPHWTPDGKYVTFVSNRTGTFERWAIRPDGTDLHRITRLTPPAAGTSGAVVVSRQPARSESLPAGFEPRKWAPGGRHVVGRVLRAAGQPPAVGVYSLNERDLWMFAESGGCFTWLQDGSRFLFRTGSDILAADVRQRGIWPLVPRAADAVPGGCFTVSPDQQLIYFILMQVEDSIWMAERRSD